MVTHFVIPNRTFKMHLITILVHTVPNKVFMIFSVTFLDFWYPPIKNEQINKIKMNNKCGFTAYV